MLLVLILNGLHSAVLMTVMIIMLNNQGSGSHLESTLTSEWLLTPESFLPLLPV